MHDEDQRPSTCPYTPSARPRASARVLALTTPSARRRPSAEYLPASQLLHVLDDEDPPEYLPARNSRMTKTQRPSTCPLPHLVHDEDPAPEYLHYSLARRAEPAPVQLVHVLDDEAPSAAEYARITTSCTTKTQRPSTCPHRTCVHDQREYLPASQLVHVLDDVAPGGRVLARATTRARRRPSARVPARITPRA